MICVECGTKIDITDLEGKVIECSACGIELELIEGRLIGLQLGPSEE